MGPDGMIFVFWMLSFNPIFSLSSFTFKKSLLSSSLLSAIRVVSSSYLRLLIFLPAILIPACASSSPAFFMMFPYSSVGKEFACSAGDLGSIPGLGRSLEEGMATHPSILAWRIPIDRGAWGAILSMGSQRVRHEWETKPSSAEQTRHPTCSVSKTRD